jgi:hypothetical protein
LIAKANRAQKIRDKNREFLVQKLKFRMLERGSVKGLFNEIDADGNGSVTMKELKLALLRMNIHTLAGDFVIYFSEMDKDKNGVVELAELDSYLKHPPRSKSMMDTRCMALTTIQPHRSPTKFGTADRRVGWEERRALQTENQHNRKFVHSQFGNQLFQAGAAMPRMPMSMSTSSSSWTSSSAGFK